MHTTKRNVGSSVGSQPCKLQVCRQRTRAVPISAGPLSAASEAAKEVGTKQPVQQVQATVSPASPVTQSRQSAAAAQSQTSNAQPLLLSKASTVISRLKTELRAAWRTVGTEMISGRACMLVFAGALAAEHATGHGLLTLLGYEAHAEINALDGLGLFSVAYVLASAVLPPAVPTPEEQRAEAAAALGKSPVFMQAQELWIGRAAKLGLGCSIIGEALTGMGPLAQLQLPHRGAAIIAFAILMFAASAEDHHKLASADVEDLE